MNLSLLKYFPNSLSFSALKKLTLQKLAPRSHLLGRSSFKSSKVNGSAEHLQIEKAMYHHANDYIILIKTMFLCNWMMLITYSHSPSLVQIPVFFSWTLQLAMQDHSPMEHRNPASTKLIDADPKKKKVINVRRFIVQCS